jgi:uncharacterized membrane protein
MEILSKICRDFMNSQNPNKQHKGCTRNNCKFIHDENLCYFFYKGECKKGDNCNFNHFTEISHNTNNNTNNINTNNNNNKNNKKELQIEALIKKLYYGGATKDINNLLVEITGNDKIKLLNPYDPNEVITNVQHGNMRIIDIARFLNSASILRRNKPWNTKSVSDLL